MKKLLIGLLIRILTPVGSRTGALYGLGKVHKETKNGLPSFRSILSAIGMPTYKLAKSLLLFLTPLTHDDENTPQIPKDVFLNLLTVATKESFFMFNNKFYKQIDGVAMGSPLGPALANILCAVLKIKIALIV